ncbi:MAG: alanine racemase [Bryobacterales bacterium]|jgi:alanine racemase|nr:alanine racemase [Bryobacterales bacterium]
MSTTFVSPHVAHPVDGPPFRTFVEVSLTTIRDNYASVASRVKPGAHVMPVVKANAYGHGALPVAHALIRSGARWLAVSSVMEGVALREGGVTPPVSVLVMAGVQPFEWPLVLRHQLTPVLHSLEEVRFLNHYAAAENLSIGFHFKFDTGLSRLGSLEPLSAIVPVFQSLASARLEGVMTHFAAAADLGSHRTQQQATALSEAVATLRGAGIPPFLVHIDATNSLHLHSHAADVQLVRPGHAIYGYVTNPRQATAAGALVVRPALQWKARVILTKRLPPGVFVGYGSQFRTTRNTTIAVLAVGYGDGYPHQLSNRAYVLIHGHRASILGAVSMDLTTVDITDLPLRPDGSSVRHGDLATLIGSDGAQQITAIQLGRMASTISYAVLCGIGQRVPRIYPDGSTAEGERRA